MSMNATLLLWSLEPVVLQRPQKSSLWCPCYSQVPCYSLPEMPKMYLSQFCLTGDTSSHPSTWTTSCGHRGCFLRSHACCQKVLSPTHVAQRHVDRRLTSTSCQPMRVFCRGAVTAMESLVAPPQHTSCRLRQCRDRRIDPDCTWWVVISRLCWYGFGMTCQFLERLARMNCRHTCSKKVWRHWVTNNPMNSKLGRVLLDIRISRTLIAGFFTSLKINPHSKWAN